MNFFTALLAQMPDAVAKGLIWGLMALGVYITYKILDFPDLTVDGSLCTGGAVAAVMIVSGIPAPVALVGALIAGGVTGAVTGILHTKMGIPGILAGILTQLALYSINLRIMGNRSNVSVSVDQFPLMACCSVWALWRCCAGSSAPSWAAPSGPPAATPTWPGPRGSTRTEPRWWP